MILYPFTNVRGRYLSRSEWGISKPLVLKHFSSHRFRVIMKYKYSVEINTCFSQISKNLKISPVVFFYLERTRCLEAGKLKKNLLVKVVKKSTYQKHNINQCVFDLYLEMFQEILYLLFLILKCLLVYYAFS